MTRSMHIELRSPRHPELRLQSSEVNDDAGSAECDMQVSITATRTERRSADGPPPDLAVRFRDVLVLYTLGISEPGEAWRS